MPDMELEVLIPHDGLTSGLKRGGLKFVSITQQPFVPFSQVVSHNREAAPP